MGKKRVHEIAKDLKAHGIDLETKELVAELQSLDFDVKTHSSSLDEDQAAVAVQRIVEKRKPKQAPAPVQAAGFVVRRKKVEPTPVEAPPQADAQPVAPQQPVEAAPVQPAAEAEQVPAAAEVTPQQPVAAAETEPVAAPVTEPEAAPAAAAAPQTAETPVAPQQPTQPARPVGPTIRREVTASELARPPAVRPAVRPPVRTDGQQPPGQPPAGDGSPQPKPPAVDPRTLRPTANQAVVISRPLIPVKRVTPPTGAHTQIPRAPGVRAIGEVRELKVGTDFLGRREFTDVNQDKKKGSRVKEGIKESLTKQELQDLSRGRTSLPLRVGKKKRPVKKGAKTQITEMAEEKKVIKLDESITVSDLSKTLGVKANELIKKLMQSGKMVTINSLIDVDTAEILASDYGWRIERKGQELVEAVAEVEDRPEDLRPRPPVVTIMGHVDHGKTSLLDAIRQADVAAGEAGGITQHIGAYSVVAPDGRPITFLDTPGHEAFSAMRARGAKVTDLAIIVVAADDGVMPQTREAINHAKAAEVPILVAINKMDKPGANPQTVKNGLMELGLVDEQLGGDTIMVPVSAKTKQGLPDLLEMIALQADVLELKANPNKPARGTVVEAKLEKGRGPVATVIVHEGTLKVGDALVTGTHSGKIRAMLNDRGDKVEEVPPGYPVEILGLSGVPSAGDEFTVVADENLAKEIADKRGQKEREKELSGNAKVSLEDLFNKVQKGDVKELKVIVKADVQGSAEAVSDALKKLSGKKVTVKVLHTGVGGINESDVNLASASDAIIVGFNSKAESKAADAASQFGVQIKTYSVIYEAVDEVRSAMEGLLAPTLKEKAMGRAEVRNLFNVPKLGTIAGCAVTDGKIVRSAMVRVVRDGKTVHTGKIASLKRFKDDVREVASGFECGLSIENFSDIKTGDIIEAYEIEEIRQKLE